ncbi:MAG: virulence RhuM family protein [Desulfarculus sp.]|nr:virulence RhuM family protein [Desulfarculus sp.]
MSEAPINNLPVLSPEGRSEFTLYKSDDGQTRVQVRLQEGTVWLPQRLIAELYQKDVRTISEHIQNIFSEGELRPEATIRKFRIVQTEGQRQVERLLDFYNLDMILAVGYRVRSLRGTQFRQWATRTLREFVVKGFALDDERLKESRTLGEDYFDELLERIRSIRASERRFYQKITDIYATSIDYDPGAEITKTFYATVQNKLHWAITGRTAAEIIRQRADAAKPHMGLSTWKRSPHGPVRKTDAAVAKNYLSEEELSQLNLIVGMYLDYADLQARNRRPMHMADWIKRLDGFLEFNERNILTHAGKVSHELAQAHAEREFEKYEAERRRLEAEQPTSDFDKAVEEVKRLGQGASEGVKPKCLPPAKPATRKAVRKRKMEGSEDE